ncbi:phage tail protein I, partial [Photobacterium sp. WH24]|uniref:phage tail protein I n=1 Tax=Photobacterium sp. WH24 TaxID=2827237 RepID=UPI001C485226
MSDQRPLDDETLLPNNRTPFERSFEEGMKDLATTEDVYSWLHDPLKTDTRLLDLMAKEAGVKDWFFDDSEQAKRQSIDLAHLIMQKAGTRTGLKDALEALGISAQVIKG